MNDPHSHAGPLLTDAEHTAVSMLGEVYTLLCNDVVAHGPTREADCAELRHHIHGLQHAIMSQAAARAFPHQFRLLGGLIEEIL